MVDEKEEILSEEFGDQISGEFTGEEDQSDVLEEILENSDTSQEEEPEILEDDIEDDPEEEDDPEDDPEDETDPEDEDEIELKDGEKAEKIEGDLILEKSDVEGFKSLTSFAGQSITKLFKSYDNAVKIITTTRQENSTLRDENDDLSFENQKLRAEIEDLRARPVSEDKEEDVPGWDEMPDPVENPKEFAKFMDKRDAALLKKNQPKQKQEVQADPQLQKNSVYVNEFVANSLPQNVTSKEAVALFVRRSKHLLNADGTVNQENFNLMLKDPVTLAKRIVNAGKEIAVYKSKKAKQKDLSEEAEKQVSKLKKKSKDAKRKSRTTTKRTVKKAGLSSTEQMLAEIDSEISAEME